jgi:hypothetical protein
MSTNLQRERENDVDRLHILAHLSKTDLTLMFSFAEVSKNSKPRTEREKEKRQIIDDPEQWESVWM